MSGLKKYQCELPQKPWKDYSSDEIRRFCLRNMRNMDCSFKGEDEKNYKARKVHESFKWILCEMLPVLKEILNNKENQAKNCKEIVVSNPKHIEVIVFYAHMKIVDTGIFNLVDCYEASKDYQIKALEDEVIEMFNYVENQKKADWVKLLWLSFVKYPEDHRIRAIFEKIKIAYYDNVPEANIDLVLELDKECFDIFFDKMLRHHFKPHFKITEAYLIKHFFDGNKNKKLEEIDPFQRNLVEWYMNNLCGWFNWDEYKNGPLVSNLLTTNLKIEHLQRIVKRFDPHLVHEPNEVWTCIQKLRKGNPS